MAEPITPEESRQKGLSTSIVQFLEHYPLYRSLENPRNAVDLYGVPPRLTFACHCTEHPVTTWSGERCDSGPAGTGDVMLLRYSCTNCYKSKRVIILLIEQIKVGDKKTLDTRYTKIGEYPKLGVFIPKSAEKYCERRDIELLRKAVQSRNANHGIAALTYLRRVVENILEDVRVQALKDNPQNAVVLNGIPKLRSFDERFAAIKPYLNEVLKASDPNPLKLIYDSASNGIHGFDDSKCGEKFDPAIALLWHHFDELLLHEKKRQVSEHAKKLMHD